MERQLGLWVGGYAGSGVQGHLRVSEPPLTSPSLTWPDIVDIKPANMEDLTEVITASEFHPHHCNLFVYSSSKGSLRLCDMRAAALCDKHSKRKCPCPCPQGAASEWGWLGQGSGTELGSTAEDGPCSTFPDPQSGWAGLTLQNPVGRPLSLSSWRSLPHAETDQRVSCGGSWGAMVVQGWAGPREHEVTKQTPTTQLTLMGRYEPGAAEPSTLFHLISTSSGEARCRRGHWLVNRPSSPRLKSEGVGLKPRTVGC